MTAKEDRKALERSQSLLKIKSFQVRLKELMENDGFVEGMDCPADDCNDVMKKMLVEWTVLEDGRMQYRSVDILACKCGFRIRPPEKEVVI